MKHVEEFITERKNFKDYRKYNDIIKDKYFDPRLNNIDQVVLFEEDNIIYLDMVVWQHIFDYYIDTYIKEMGDNIRYTIYSKNGNQIRLILENISKEFIEGLELEYNAKKYNL